MNRHFILALCLVLASGCPSSAVKPSRDSRSPARKISDRLAEGELRKQEVIHKRHDPNVKLRLKDYKVSESESAESYEFFYEYDNLDVNFMLWDGHPMHFAIMVNKKDGTTELMSGQ